MEPNIGKGVWVFVKRNVLGASLSDGKVVLYRNQDNREKLGRIYASAGESVAFFDQSLYLKKNGKIYIFNEFGKGRNYVDPRVSDVENQWILMGEGQYFVLPDGWESGPIEFKDQIIDQRKIIGEVI